MTGDSKVGVRSLDGHSPPDRCDVESYVEVNSPTASLIFVASDEKNQDKWVDAFRKVISTIKELQSSGEKDRKPRDVRGMHSFNVHGSTFHVDKKYKLIKPIGHGAYGVVVSAKDEEGKRKVAIKKVSNAFEDLVDAKRILREIKLLRHFNHENIIRIVDVRVVFALSKTHTRTHTHTHSNSSNTGTGTSESERFSRRLHRDRSHGDRSASSHLFQTSAE